jgi:hypothetical protein
MNVTTISRERHVSVSHDHVHGSLLTKRDRCGHVPVITEKVSNRTTVVAAY